MCCDAGDEDGDGESNDEEEGDDAGKLSKAAVEDEKPPAQETFSDVDDEEISNYLATNEEAEMKTAIWQVLNECVIPEKK